jgi:hypothetical protein
LASTAPSTQNVPESVHHTIDSLAENAHLVICDRLAKESVLVPLVHSSQQLRERLACGRVRLLNILHLKEHKAVAAPAKQFTTPDCRFTSTQPR